MILRVIRQSLFALLLIVPATVLAQTQTQTNVVQAGSTDQQFKPEQLEALVAPIALYPDSLLATVLMASTYPLEVVQADRWATENKNLKGDDLKAAVDKQSWDDSIKALVATPSVLSQMSTKLDWTQTLGDAVLAQQADVMDAIQRLRAKAQANNKLETTPQQTVTVTQPSGGGQQIIAIESASADTVYVPYYDPGVVYGGWPYSDYQPYYFGYPSYIGAAVIGAGVAFGTGYLVGRWAGGNRIWGGGVNWGNRNIVANRTTNINTGNIGNNWQHNPAHRQGVRYSNANVQQRYGNANRAAGAQQRMDFRGRSGEQVLNPGGGNRGGAAGAVAGGLAGGAAGAALANRGNNAANRPGGGNNATNRPGGGNAANRPGGGNATNRPGGGGSNVANRPSGGAGAANRPSGGGAGNRPTTSNRPAQTASRAGNNAFSNVSSGQRARAQSARGQASMGNARASVGMGGGGPRVGGGGGGGFRGGGGGGRGGGGRRSDIALKHDVVLLGHLDNGLGFYRFSYNGSDKAYVGVIAQEVQSVMPSAVVRGRDGFLRVFYDKLGLKFESYQDWLAEGAHIPTARTH